MNNVISYLNNKTIALVGNASSIFDKNWTNEINSHDIVWRMNWGVNLNAHQKKLVGNRCEVYCAGGPRGAKTTFTTEQPKYKLFVPGNIELFNKAPIGFYTIQKQLVLELIEQLKQKDDPETILPSTGLITLKWLIDKTNTKITLFGFDFFKTRTWYRNMGHFGAHRPDREQKLFGELIDNEMVILSS